MDTVPLNRGETSAITFTITDDANAGLAGRRVTWTVALKPNGTPILSKASGLGSSSGQVALISQSSVLITGTIAIALADYDVFTKKGNVNQHYFASLWIDDGNGTQQCVTKDGADLLIIVETVPRA